MPLLPPSSILASIALLFLAHSSVCCPRLAFVFTLRCITCTSVRSHSGHRRDRYIMYVFSHRQIGPLRSSTVATRLPACIQDPSIRTQIFAGTVEEMGGGAGKPRGVRRPCIQLPELVESRRFFFIRAGNGGQGSQGGHLERPTLWKSEPGKYIKSAICTSSSSPYCLHQPIARTPRFRAVMILSFRSIPVNAVKRRVLQIFQLSNLAFVSRIN